MVYTTHKNDDSADGLWNWVNPELGSSCWICLPALTLPVMTAVVKLGTGVGLHGCETIVITAPRWSRPSAQQACAATAGLCLGNLQCNYQFLRKVWAVATSFVCPWSHVPSSCSTRCSVAQQPEATINGFSSLSLFILRNMGVGWNWIHRRMNDNKY
jgi:hypothetical protein